MNPYCELCQARLEIAKLKGSGQTQVIDLEDTNASAPSVRTLTLHKQLDRLINERRTSYRALSQASGIPLKTLYHWRAGQIPKADERLFRLAEILKVELKILLFGET